MEATFGAFSREVQSLGQAKVQTLRELMASLEREAPRFFPQIQAQKYHIQATWERLNKAIEARREVGHFSSSVELCREAEPRAGFPLFSPRTWLQPVSARALSRPSQHSKAGCRRRLPCWRESSPATACHLHSSCSSIGVCRYRPYPGLLTPAPLFRQKICVPHKSLVRDDR